MQEDRIPKIFISYSWSCDALVLPLAQRLVNHGVDVVLDKWDLKEGQDKYAFMEQCVTDPDISKVLIICDKAYMEKANARKGGVGDETVIISGEVYGRMKQEKFIPIIAERDENGNPYVPVYIKTRIYIDLSREEAYEDEYEKLLRNIYEKPQYSKPKLGKRPEWLDEEKTNLFPLHDLIRQIKGATLLSKQQSCVTRFIEAYLTTLKSYYTANPTAAQVYSRFLETKPVRDVFLDFIPALAETELPFADIMCSIFEKFYNTLLNRKWLLSESYSSRDYDLEVYKILIWELFICTIAYLRHVEDYRSINGIVANTYFLNSPSSWEKAMPRNYCQFKHYSGAIEEDYKPQTEQKNKFTLLGHTVCTEREKLPVFSGEAIAEADVFLYQVRNAFDLVEDKERWQGLYWFPHCYVYCNAGPTEWKKMRSRKFCQKMFVLFGVSTIEELKTAISKCHSDRETRYSGSFESAPSILSCIKLEQIGELI